MSMPNAVILRDPRHHHDPAGPEGILSALQSAGIRAALTEDVSVVSRLGAEKINVLVLYTQGETFSADQVRELTGWVRAGNAIVGIHSATATNKSDDAYAKLMGSRFIGHGPVFDFSVKVSDSNHPIAHRLTDFRVTDELYLLEPFDKFHVFLTAWWGGKEQPVGYEKSEGKGKVIYLANGHDPRSLNNKTVQQLITRAVRYAAGIDWTEKTVKVAAIGYGGAFNMGKLHLDSCKRARMTPVAVCDVDPKRTAVAKTDLGEQIQVYNKVDDLLAKSDAEMVVIITPHNTHAPLAIQCLESGRHVVTEKPFTITVDESTRVIDAARKAGKMATVFHNRRWDGDFMTIKKLIDAGAIGEVTHVECYMGSYGEPSPGWWRSYKDISGGIMHDWGAHFVDWMLQLMPFKIESVSGDFRKQLWHQVSIEDHGVAYVRFEGGRTAQLEISNISAIGKSRFRILGTLGGIEQKGWDEKEGLTLVSYKDNVKMESKVPFMKSDWDGFYRNIADHLILGEPLVVTPESARKVIGVISLAEESSRRGGMPIGLGFEQ
jgi:scyllo-inositol 2-dehydrogenase (NADP+)